MVTQVDIQHMHRALALAQTAAEKNEVPIGAVLVMEGNVIGVGHNQTQSLNDPTAHAEIMAIRAAASAIQNSRLPQTTLYVTVEPCCMCVGALIHARVSKLVFGAREPRTGAVVSAFDLLMSQHHNHQVAIKEGVLAEECAVIMQRFFSSRR